MVRCSRLRKLHQLTNIRTIRLKKNRAGSRFHKFSVVTVSCQVDPTVGLFLQSRTVWLILTNRRRAVHWPPPVRSSSLLRRGEGSCQPTGFCLVALTHSLRLLRGLLSKRNQNKQKSEVVMKGKSLADPLLQIKCLCFPYKYGLQDRTASSSSSC